MIVVADSGDFGVGVAMGITPYVDDNLAAGRLVASFDVCILKMLRWYLVYREARADEPAFATFRNWIRGLPR